MGVSLTVRAQKASAANVKEPNIVLEIEGVGTYYGALQIKKAAKIGDPGLIIGDPLTDDGAFYVGGLTKLSNQENAISMNGTTTSIKQILQIDLGQGSSISSMSIALIDTGSITKLITPGQVISDILQARCKVYLGFANTAFPDDYIVIFRGVVTDVSSDASKVTLTLNHPDDKKKGTIFSQIKDTTTEAVDSSQTVINVTADIPQFLLPLAGPSGVVDNSFISGCLIDNEVIKFTQLINKNSATVTMTIATPCVVTWAAHGLVNGVAIQLATTGALPTGLSVGTTYYIVSATTNTFQLAATRGGSAINTTGTQSGVHTATCLAAIAGCTRAQLGTTAATHGNGSTVQSFYQLTGNCIDLALKLLASTGNGSTAYLTGLAATSFVDVDGTSVANALYFKGTNVVDKYNIQIGDYITTTGATNGANNVTLQQITDIIDFEGGQYLVIGGASFVSESTTSALVSFVSQYNTLPDGLGLINDEIDFDQHIYLQTSFLGDFTYLFYLKDTITDTRTFIETEIYSPVACFSLPTNSRCSVGYHIGPIPGQNIASFDKTNIKEPSKMKLVRSTNRQFYNEIVYQYDEDVLSTDFLGGVITDSELSKAQIKSYNKTLTIQSHGLRTSLDAQNIATSQSNRRLNRYQYGAEVLSIGVTFASGFAVQVGDVVWVDGTDLNLPDIKTAKKGMAGRYFFVQNKSLNIMSGDVQLDLIDTHFSGTGRYGLIAPASVVDSGISTTQFVIKAGYYKKYGDAEHKKWTNLIGADVRVRSLDFSYDASTKIVDASSNTITVFPALSFIPSSGMVMEFVHYNNQTLDKAKLIYSHMSNTDFSDGKQQFLML